MLFESLPEQIQRLSDFSALKLDDCQIRVRVGDTLVLFQQPAICFDGFLLETAAYCAFPSANTICPSWPKALPRVGIP